MIHWVIPNVATIHGVIPCEAFEARVGASRHAMKAMLELTDDVILTEKRKLGEEEGYYGEYKDIYEMSKGQDEEFLNKRLRLLNDAVQLVVGGTNEDLKVNVGGARGSCGDSRCVGFTGASRRCPEG